MKHYLFALFTALLASSSVKAQSTYWQQEIQYTISVKLDDKRHQLSGFESFVYTNNSPQSLDFLYIHLWPNAYTSGETALGKQQYQDGEQLLAFGADSVKGGIDSLNFSVNGTPAKWELDAENPDIAKLFLPTNLRTGQSITVTTPFRVKIPSGEISRLGHIGQSYQITQWYPKPAVYDKNGWNQMPYLNQGEFYSEFGSYDVSITLPKNYVVGATGDLQTESEIAFLEEKFNRTKSALSDLLGQDKEKLKKKGFPDSETAYKTIRYTQTNVHDFAWFADKRYCVLKGEVELPHSKRKVTTWAMFVPQNVKYWQKAIEYINDGTYYYSKWNGDYPYNQVTAVDGTISAGGGMEYPNVTVIGNASSAMDLEIVIVHEVGHNWFYGILGTNERLHGWMDEGMNTLNELRYIYTKYPDNDNLSDMLLNGRLHADHLSHYDMSDLSYRVVAGMGEDQPIETHSAEFTTVNYGAVMYMKTGLVFNYLKQYLGDETFDRCMQKYYDQWKFKHPQPEDMRAVLEKESGKDLSWLFEDLIQTTDHVDYRLKKVTTDENQTIAVVKNVGQVNGPIEVGAYQEGKLVETVWTEPSEEKSEVRFNVAADEVRINPSGRLPEMYRDNNNWHRSGLFGKWEKLKPEFFIGDNEQGKSNVFWMPLLAANQYDKLMAGVLIHNYTVPFSKFQYLMAPMYSTGGNRLSGMADFQYTFLPKNRLKLSRFGVSFRSFKLYNDPILDKNDGNFATISPFWFAKLGNRKAATPWSHSLLVQTFLRQDRYNHQADDSRGGFIKYMVDCNRADNEWHFITRLDYLNADKNLTDYLTRVSAEATYRLRYMRKEKDRWMEWRMYLGMNVTSSANLPQHRLSLSGANGTEDLFVEDYYFARSATQGFLANQRLENMGAFKSPTIEGSDTWLATLNFYSQLPVGPSIFGVFADVGYVPPFLGINSFNNDFYFDAGLGIRLGKVAGLYFPLIQSNNILNAYGTMNYTARIRFTLRMSITNRGINFSGLI